MDLPELLRALRLGQELSQVALAGRAGVSPSSLSRFESGATRPSWATLDRLLTACGKDVRFELVERHADLWQVFRDRAALHPNRRQPLDDFLRGSLLGRLAESGADVQIAGSWAADLHGVPREPADGVLRLSAVPERLDAFVAVFGNDRPRQMIEGRYSGVPLLRRILTEQPGARWRLHDTGTFNTPLVEPGQVWPPEQRVDTPFGPLRVVPAAGLTRTDGVLPDVLEQWLVWRATEPAPPAVWSAPPSG